MNEKNKNKYNPLFEQIFYHSDIKVIEVLFDNITGFTRVFKFILIF